MKFVLKQSTKSRKNFIINSNAYAFEMQRNSATGYNNDLFVQKDNEWICSLCYETVTPKLFIKDENGNIDKSKKILFVNKNTNVPHRRQKKKFGQNTHRYYCIMAHFKREKEKEFPIDEDNCCKICNTKVVEKRHPFIDKIMYVNLKDSKIHFKRHRSKWVCIL